MKLKKGDTVQVLSGNDKGKTGSAHNICFFPTLKDIKGFSKEMEKHIKNMTLSSQRPNISAYELIDIAEKYSADLYFESAGTILTLITLRKIFRDKIKRKNKWCNKQTYKFST